MRHHHISGLHGYTPYFATKNLSWFVSLRNQANSGRRPGLRDQRQSVDEPVETPNVTGVMSHQVDDHDRVDEVVIDEEAEMIPMNGHCMWAKW